MDGLRGGEKSIPVSFASVAAVLLSDDTTPSAYAACISIVVGTGAHVRMEAIWSAYGYLSGTEYVNIDVLFKHSLLAKYVHVVSAPDGVDGNSTDSDQEGVSQKSRQFLMTPCIQGREHARGQPIHRANCAFHRCSLDVLEALAESLECFTDTLLPVAQLSSLQERSAASLRITYYRQPPVPQCPTLPPLLHVQPPNTTSIADTLVAETSLI